MDGDSPESQRNDSRPLFYLRGYFETVNGMDDEMDTALNRFWPLSRTKLASEELSDIHPDRWAYPDCYIFADHSIWCFAFGVKLGCEYDRCSGPVVFVTGGLPVGKQIADSFPAFVEMYLQDPMSVVKAVA
jgi:hypothetical protein